MKFPSSSSPPVALAALLALCSVCYLGSASGQAVYGGGSEAWSGWSTVVDGVMGGKSSGTMEPDGQAVRFYGTISLDGGGFSSISRRLAPAADLSTVAGFLVTIDALPEGSEPMALQLSLNVAGSFWSHGAAFVVQPGPAGTEQQLFLPMKSFNEASWNGRRCQSDCELDPSAVTRVGLFVLFQEGPFELRIHRIETVASAADIPLNQVPVIDLTGDNATAEFLDGTIARGAVLYDKGYPALSTAVYAAALQTLLAADGPPQLMKNITCPALHHIADQDSSAEVLAWMLRRVINVIMADLEGTARPDEQSYPAAAQGDWLDTANATACAADMTASGAVATLISGTGPAAGTSGDGGASEASLPGMASSGGSASVQATSAASSVRAGGTWGPMLSVTMTLASAMMAAHLGGGMLPLL
mmetsp:Transcript_25954/g.65287  ORF Transcript_25954/g.65287 Transcript_25954/m.65287 type:complete len:416 (-) Transcript_25954:102-1349(-)